MMHSNKSIIEWIGNIVSWLILGVIGTTFAIVVLRYAFDYGRIDLQESSIYFHAIALMLCMSYTLRHNGHTRVDIFYQHFSPRRKVLVNLIGHWLFLIPMCVFTIWISWDYVATSWRVMERSAESGGLPLVFVIKSLTPLMAVLLLIQALSDSARYIAQLRKPSC